MSAFRVCCSWFRYPWPELVLRSSSAAAEAAPRRTSRLSKTPRFLLLCTFAITACGSEDNGGNQTTTRADNSTIGTGSNISTAADREAEDAAGSPDAVKGVTARAAAADRIPVFANSLICGRFERHPALPSDLLGPGQRPGLLSVLFRPLGARLDQLGIPRSRPGDTSGHRFRRLEGGDDRLCRGDSSNINVHVRVSRGPSGGPPPAAGRPSIIPYTLVVTAEAGETRWERRVERIAGEAHPAVTADPRTRSGVAATQASLVNDLSDLGHGLSRALVRGSE